MCLVKTSCKKLTGISRTSTCQTMTAATERCTGLFLSLTWAPAIPRERGCSLQHLAAMQCSPMEFILPSLNFMWALMYNFDMAEHLICSKGCIAAEYRISSDPLDKFKPCINSCWACLLYKIHQGWNIGTEPSHHFAALCQVLLYSQLQSCDQVSMQSANGAWLSVICCIIIWFVACLGQMRFISLPPPCKHKLTSPSELTVHTRKFAACSIFELQVDTNARPLGPGYIWDLAQWLQVVKALSG